LGCVLGLPRPYIGSWGAKKEKLLIAVILEHYGEKINLMEFSKIDAGNAYEIFEELRQADKD
jgi:hypothetical protein